MEKPRRSHFPFVRTQNTKASATNLFVILLWDKTISTQCRSCCGKNNIIFTDKPLRPGWSIGLLYPLRFNNRFRASINGCQVNVSVFFILRDISPFDVICFQANGTNFGNRPSILRLQFLLQCRLEEVLCCLKGFLGIGFQGIYLGELPVQNSCSGRETGKEISILRKSSISRFFCAEPFPNE